MCGVAGLFNRSSGKPADASAVERMVSALGHRGPDATGSYLNETVSLGHSRLSIIDLETGAQPMANETGDVHIVFNGEIYNYIELRRVLLSRGHRFSTRSDTEVIVHLYEEYGRDFVSHMNGQFALAIWDERKKLLTLARDRVGICPLYYAVDPDNDFLFASEIKSFFASGLVAPAIDVMGLHQVLTLWVTVPPRTCFRNVHELPPAHVLEVSEGSMALYRYWNISFPEKGSYGEKPLRHYISGVREILSDAIRLRLRADVPVAAYLSGGLDSSVIASLTHRYFQSSLTTFSVTFEDASFDESLFQEELVRMMGLDHRSVAVDYRDIGGAFADVVRHAEVPLLRTAPSPLYHLSGLVRRNNIKVVLTGEGADEIFGGYNIFKEDAIRRFWARRPESNKRPLLLGRLYPYVRRDNRAGRFWQSFFKRGMMDVDNPWYSHAIRWANTGRIKDLLADDVRTAVSEGDVFDELRAYTDPGMNLWHPLCRAQYLEMLLFLPGYLLSSQGDRMMMSHSVEGRFPFLDHRLIEFAAGIPPLYKLRGLNEKYILKRAFDDLLPQSIITRDKQPYRSPVYRSLSRMEECAPDQEAHPVDAVFDPVKTGKLIQKARNSPDRVSSVDEMAVCAYVSTRVLVQSYGGNQYRSATGVVDN
ncbi:MAG TPA: asparagine synthase (glutamine-hydrolyzing) [Spirochaetota bacterium]|nr:asparagine synthase (glutamine-hydrolyzing) [Spirochaetota bacterium]HPI90181.1 asparagine synthase (glutamine-hydrolyzing) [Spirochaetota bacterium]HPR49620.1 asparagine synthase (glutamine-hydrolyzing) [Spirochaetota bacterium]